MPLLCFDQADYRRSYLLPATVRSTIPHRPQPGEVGAHWVARGLLVEVATALRGTPLSLTYREHHPGLDRSSGSNQAADGGSGDRADACDHVAITALVALPATCGDARNLTVHLHYGNPPVGGRRGSADATGPDGLGCAGDHWRLTVDGAIPDHGTGTHLPSPAMLGRTVAIHYDDHLRDCGNAAGADPGASDPTSGRIGRSVQASTTLGGLPAMARPAPIRTPPAATGEGRGPARGMRVLDLTDEPVLGETGGERSTPPGHVYVELPPIAEATALIAGVINVALAAERGRQDLSGVFRLLPIAAEETSAAGRPYRVLRWGVFVPDPDYAGIGGPHGDLVSYGALRRRRDGQLRYDPRGLYEPLADSELDRLLAAAGEPRDGAAPAGTLRSLSGAPDVAAGER